MSEANYAYAALESQVRVSVATNGWDPDVGFLHASRRGRQAFVCDLMEPFRPVVDRCVLDLIQRRVFAPGDFLITDQGNCRIHPQLARVVSGVSSSMPGHGFADEAANKLRALDGDRT